MVSLDILVCKSNLYYVICIQLISEVTLQASVLSTSLNLKAGVTVAAGLNLSFDIFKFVGVFSGALDEVYVYTIQYILCTKILYMTK